MNEGHSKHAHDHPHGPKKRAIHKDWRAWVVVGLMLLAMVVYVLSMDESIQPDSAGQNQPPVPAAP